METTVSNESQLYFERGGPMYRLMERCRLILPGDPSIRRRAIAFLLLSWVPMAILSALQGLAMADTAGKSFLLDFASYARFFLAVPLLFIAETVVGPRLVGAGLNFIHGGFVKPEQYPAFEQAVSRVTRRRESVLAEGLLVVVALVGAWTLTSETITGVGKETWRTLKDGAGTHFSYAGMWNQFIAVPIIQFLLYRWIWRLLIWTLFLWEMSRLDLQLVPTHADQAGGLGFLGGAHTSFAIFGFGISAIISAGAAFQLIFEGADIRTLESSFIVLVVVLEFVFLGPLLVFGPVMARVRLQWLKTYSQLVLDYNRAFHEKWITGTEKPSESLLGSADIQSLADLGTGLEYARSMKIVPFGRRLMLQLVVAVVLPGLPLLLLVMPVDKLLNALSGAVF